MAKQRHAFEVVTWPCSEEYVKDPSIVNAAFELLAGPGGPSGLNEIFYGIEVGRSNAYAVLNWDSIEAHENFRADQEARLGFVKLFESSAKDGVPQGIMIHASWEEEAALACLKAPFIELTKIRPKKEITTEAIHGILDKYVAYKNDPSSGAVGATYGQVVEEGEELVVVVGLESKGENSKAGKEAIREACEEEVVISVSMSGVVAGE